MKNGITNAVRIMARFVLGFFSLATVLHAQTPPPLGTPRLELSMNGVVFAIAQLPDGSYLIGGNFESIDGQPRSNLAKLRPDGTLDTSWILNVDGSFSAVYAIAVDSNGEAYIGGNFASVGGVARTHVARLVSGDVAGVDPDWGPLIDSFGVSALALDESSVYIGGQFNALGGEHRRGLGKVPKDGIGPGAVDHDWFPMEGVSGAAEFRALLYDGAGSLFVGGAFNRIGGLERRDLAKLSTSGQGAANPEWNPQVDRSVNALAFGPGNSLYIGGDFQIVDDEYRGGVARIASGGIGEVDLNWQGFGQQSIRANALGVDSLGRVYLGGEFGEIVPSMGNIARFLSNGALDPAWSTRTDARVDSLAIGTGDVLYLGGHFTQVGREGRVGLARISAGVTVLAPINAAINTNSAAVTSMARAPDGSLVIGGEFEVANGVARKNILRMTPGGELDPIWNPGNQSKFRQGIKKIRSLAVDFTGDVYVSGGFERIGGEPRVGLAKLQSSGGGLADPAWRADLDPGAAVEALALGEAGSIFIGGSFDNIGGVQRHKLARISTLTGSLDLSWNPNPDSEVMALLIGNDGFLIVGGFFHTIGGQSFKYLAKIDSGGTGAADPQWNPVPNSGVETLARDPTGELYIGGYFDKVGTKSFAGLAKISGAGIGSPSSLWEETMAPPGTFQHIKVIAFDPGGTLYAGGDFPQVAGQPPTRLFRFSGRTGQTDLQWKPRPDGDIRSLMAGVDGTVYVGGEFEQIGGQPRSAFAAFRSDVIFENFFE